MRCGATLRYSSLFSVSFCCCCANRDIFFHHPRRLHINISVWRQPKLRCAVPLISRVPRNIYNSATEFDHRGSVVHNTRNSLNHSAINGPSIRSQFPNKLYVFRIYDPVICSAPAELPRRSSTVIAIRI